MSITVLPSVNPYSTPISAARRRKISKSSRLSPKGLITLRIA